MNITSTKGLHADKVKLLVFGESGTGKTTLIGTLPENEVLIISAESGLLSLGDKAIDVAEVKSWHEFQEVYQSLVKLPEMNKYKTVAIDSLTEISDMLVTHLERLPEYADPKNTLKLWGEYNKVMTKLIKAYRGLDRNVIFTALTEDVQDGGVLVKKPFIKGSAAQKLLNSYFDEVLYLHVDAATGKRVIQSQPTSNISAKDRSGKLNNPEEPNLQSIFNKIKGLTTGVKAA